MAWSARMRWTAYGIAALATAAAMRWVDEAASEETVVAAAAPRRAAAMPDGSADGSAEGAAGEAAPGAPQKDRVRLDWLVRSPAAEVKTDPFGAPPPEPPPQAALREPPPPPPPAPQAPPLPFSYLGRWTEDGRTTVFLGRGGQAVAVRGAGALDATYAVESIDDRQIVFKYVPLGTLQVLPLAAPASGPRPEAKLAAAPPEPGEAREEERN